MTDASDQINNETASVTSSASKTLPQLVRAFLEYCEIDRGHSPLTISNYAHYLDRFLQFIKTKNISQPDQVTMDLIHDYRLWLNRLSDSPTLSTPDASSTNVLSRTTQNYHLIALRSFLKYLTRQDVPSLAPERIELADTPDREISFLDPEEVLNLLRAPKPTTLMGARDFAILAMLFSTGLRVAELTALNRDQVNLKTDELTVIGKGGKARLVFISEDAREALANYLKRRKDRDPALFVRHGKRAVAIARAPRKRELDSPLQEADYALKVDGKSASQLRLTPRTIQRIVKKHALSAGITKEVHPHTLRHSFATDLLGNGADIRSVQQLLGHSSITTTQIYTHVTNKQLRDIHKKFHGKGEARDV
jgi:site-specific recombinase XerD